MRFLTYLALIVAALAVFTFYDSEARSHQSTHGRYAEGRGIVSSERGHGGVHLRGIGRRIGGIVSSERGHGRAVHIRGIGRGVGGIVSSEHGHGGEGHIHRRGRYSGIGRATVITNRNGKKLIAPNSSDE